MIMDILELDRIVFLLTDNNFTTELKTFRRSHQRLKIRLRNNQLSGQLKQLKTLIFRLEVDFPIKLFQHYRDNKPNGKELAALILHLSRFIQRIDAILIRAVAVYCVSQSHFRVGHLVQHYLVVRASLARLIYCYRALLVYSVDLYTALDLQDLVCAKRSFVKNETLLTNQEAQDILSRNSCKPKPASPERPESLVIVEENIKKKIKLDDSIGQLIDRQTMRPDSIGGPKASSMSTLEDKILDGPTVHYCEADDDDIRNEDEPGIEKDDAGTTADRHDASNLFVRPDEESLSSRRTNSHSSSVSSSNTGPKGVLEDYRKRSAPSTAAKPVDIDLEDEFNELLNDDTIIESLAKQRLARQALLPTFGLVIRLDSGSQLLEAIDKEDKSTLVIVHVYTRNSRSCLQVDRCLDELARELDRIKFVTIDAGVAGLSDNFKQNGVPALLAYKGGDFIKSIVKLEDMLDSDFETSQLRELLIEHNLILQM